MNNFVWKGENYLIQDDPMEGFELRESKKDKTVAKVCFATKSYKT